MDYTLITSENSILIKNFVDADVYEGFETGDSRYAICASANDIIAGVGVFDAKRRAEIVDIAVLPKYAGKIEASILGEILAICENLPCECVSMEVSDSADQLHLEEALFAEEFKVVEQSVLHRFSLLDVDDSPLLDRVRSFDGVLSLGDADDNLKEQFANKLIREHYFEHFLDEDISQTLSTVYVQDGEIMGCVLVSDLDDSEFILEFVYVDEENASFYAYPAMLKETLVKLLDRYDYEDVYGYTLTTGRKSEESLLKVVPGAYEVDSIRTYMLVF